MKSDQGHTLLSVAQQRLHKDLEILKFNRKTSNLTIFQVSLPYREGFYLILPVSFTVVHESSIYRQAVFESIIKISPGYPYKPPTMYVKNKVFHLNIDIDSGEVCIKLLQNRIWRQEFSINCIISAFEEILIYPDVEVVPDNAINNEMKEMLLTSPEEYREIVNMTLGGGVYLDKYYFGIRYSEFKKATRNSDWELVNTKRARFNSESFIL